MSVYEVKKKAEGVSSLLKGTLILFLNLYLFYFFRCWFETSQAIVIAAAVLHNISIRMGDPMPEDDMEVLGPLQNVIIRMEGPDVVAVQPGAQVPTDLLVISSTYKLS